MLIIANVLIVYLCIRLYKAFFQKFNFLIVVPALFLLSFLFIIFRIVGTLPDVMIPQIFLDISYMILGIYIYLIIFFVFFDILRLIPPVRRFYKRFSRRIDVALVLSAFVVFGYGFYHQSQTVVETYDITFEKSLAKPLKIAAIADLHIGSAITPESLAKNVETINALNPDIILVLGDVIDIDIRDFDEEFRQILRGLKAPLGVYGVFGNHEYYSGDILEVMAVLNNAGINIVYDDVIYFEDHGFYLAGRDSLRHSKSYGDERAPISKLEPLITDKTKPVIIMDHMPRNMEDGKALGAQLQVSGHTHAGQFFPINLIVKAMYPTAYGLLKEGDFNMLVTSGLGLWGPIMRVGTQSEILEINVK